MPLSGAAICLGDARPCRLSALLPFGVIPSLPRLVNACYKFDSANGLTNPEVTNERVAKKVEEKFGTMPPEVPEFDHYAVSEFLIKNPDGTLAKLPDLDTALDRFETIFKQLNECCQRK